MRTVEAWGGVAGKGYPGAFGGGGGVLCLDLDVGIHLSKLVRLCT